ncbi:MAG: hypothetical protein JWO42_3586 [Chloroflexi bacterium]|nr:hypothetical protein [Chloroflexota bacterium]
MSLHRATRDLNAPVHPPAEELVRQPAGPVVLFIGTVLIAGLTCILYLWQQSQIVSAKQDIVSANATYTALLAQENDLIAQKNNLTSVTHVVAQAVKLGMVVGNASQFKQLSVQPSIPGSVVAQNTTPPQSSVVLPATNAAITSWWQDAWDGLFNVLQ